MNIIEYTLKRNKTFSEDPFGDMDALVLSQLAYVKYEAAGDVMGRQCPLRDLYLSEYFDGYFSDGMTDNENREMLAAAAASRRYRNAVISDLVTTTDDATGEQFAAMTWRLADDLDYISFRGTDGSIVGWKEDFQMAFRERVPAQKSAVEYINEYGRRYPERKGRLIVGGHSKGGNLAVYGAVYCSDEIQQRITDVYSLDGPGFISRVSSRIDEIVEKRELNVMRILPQGSFVGMLLESGSDYRVIRSSTMGIMQHSMYTWQIEEDKLVFADKLSAGSQYIDRTMSEWFNVATEEQREAFVTTFFGILENAEIETLADFQKLKFKDIIGMIGEFKSCDEETSRMLEGMMKSLIKSAARQVVGPSR